MTEVDACIRELAHGSKCVQVTGVVACIVLVRTLQASKLTGGSCMHCFGVYFPNVEADWGSSMYCSGAYLTNVEADWCSCMHS